MTDQKEEDLRIIKQLASRLEVDINDNKIAIATPKEGAEVAMYDGSLRAKIVPTGRGQVRVEAPRAPGVALEFVDPLKDRAPADAVYQITVYNPATGGSLDGDVYSVYVCWSGIRLDNRARERVKKLK